VRFLTHAPRHHHRPEPSIPAAWRQSSNRNALQKHAWRGRERAFFDGRPRHGRDSCADGQIQDHREKVASSRGLEPARHDNLIGWHIDCDLAVVAFYEAIAGRQDTAVRLVKFFCAQSGETQSAPRNTRSASPSRRGARRGSL